jgi:hypothetical protein
MVRPQLSEFTLIVIGCYTAIALMPLSSLMQINMSGRLLLIVEARSYSREEETMPKEHKSGPSSQASSIEISHLVHAYGITRDQARRLIGRIGNNRAKLVEAARILKARLPSRSVSEA